MAKLKFAWRVYAFQSDTFGEVRAIRVDGEPYFVGRDIAAALGYSAPQNALRRHVDEDDALKRCITDSLGREQETLLINESGLYSLILSSKLPTAKAFKRWVTSEVLPSLRKTGQYQMTQDNKQPTAYEVDQLKTEKENASIERAKMLLQLARTAKQPYKDLLKAYATKYLTGKFLLPLPEIDQPNKIINNLLGDKQNEEI